MATLAGAIPMLMYGLCFLVGGLFIFFAGVEGIDGVDFHHDFELDIAGSEKIPRQLSPFLQICLRILPILSVRFWTFGVATFGLSGLLLQGLKLTESAPQVFFLSLGMVQVSLSVFTVVGDRVIGKMKIKQGKIAWY